MSSDIEIARKANMEPILDIGAKLDIPFKALRPFGHFKAKLSSTWLQNQSKKKNMIVLMSQNFLCKKIHVVYEWNLWRLNIGMKFN